MTSSIRIGTLVSFATSWGLAFGQVVAFETWTNTRAAVVRDSRTGKRRYLAVADLKAV